MRKRFTVAIAIIFLGISWQTVGAGQDDRAQLVSVTRWTVPEMWFGGFSGIEISQDGMDIVVISDRSHFAWAHLVRRAGEITDIALDGHERMLDIWGRLPKGGFGDSEGLAQVGAGPYYVSFEGQDRLEAFDQPGGKGRSIKSERAFEKMNSNGALEALAIDAQGRLYALAEDPIGDPKVAQVFRFDGRKWSTPFHIHRSDVFRPVGADFGPDGRFYLLERGFNGIAFRSRVRRFNIGPNGLTDEVVLFTTISGTHDNLEGLTVWKDSNGLIRLTMISDDNFRFVQRTEVVEYVVPKSP